MKKFIYSIIVLIFSSNGFSQEDENVLLTLGLDSVFSKITDKEPGGSIYIEKNNQILYSRSFGLANLKTEEKFNDNTVSNAGSVTETFIAYGILILQKQGKLSIEDSIGNFFPEIKTKSGVAKVKIRDLLTHTSGLNNVALPENFSIKQIEQTDFDPGSNYKQSNADFNVLALIIEKVSNMTWEVFIQKNIFEPAGMINSKIVSESNDIETTIGYLKSNKKYKAAGNTKCYSGSVQCNDVWTTISNLRKYINAIRECVFLDCGTIAKFFQFTQPTNWRRSIPPAKGFCWFTRKLKENDVVFEYESIQNGYVTNIMMYQQTGLTVIYMGNNNTSYKDFIEKRLINLKYIK